MGQNVIGLFNTLLGMVLLILLVLSIYQAIKEEHFNLQIRLLIISVILLQPVLLFENLLFVHNMFTEQELHLNQVLLRVVFILGLVGYFIYHLYLLSLEDFPIIPLSLVLILSGFTLGIVLVSLDIDLSNPRDPIGYDPFIGGILFIITMILYSLLSFAGFIRSLYFKPFQNASDRLSVIDFIGLLGVIITPIVMFVMRILDLGLSIPFNIIFITMIIGLSLHLIQYLYRPDQFGFPIHANLLNLMVVDIEKQTVVSGYGINDTPENKLHGMAMLAMDNLMKQIIGEQEITDPRRYLGNYGDVLFLKEDKLILIASFSGMGMKIGKIVLSKFLRKYNQKISQNKEVNFKSLVEYYIFQFQHKKKDKDYVQVYDIGSNPDLTIEN